MINLPSWATETRVTSAGGAPYKGATEPMEAVLVWMELCVWWIEQFPSVSPDSCKRKGFLPEQGLSRYNYFFISGRFWLLFDCPRPKGSVDCCP